MKSKLPIFQSQGAPSMGDSKQRLMLFAMAFGQWMEVHAAPLVRKLEWDLIKMVSAILALTFVAASTISTVTANLALNGALSARKEPKSAAVSAVVQNSGSTSEISAGTLKQRVLERNIFNPAGTLPTEDDVGKMNKTRDLNFDSVPCSEGAIPVEVVGTIYTGNPKQSFVTVKDPKIADADIYKPGDLLIGFEDYEIFQVNRGTVEFRFGDQKICKVVPGFQGSGSAASSGSQGGSFAAPPAAETQEFEASYLSEQIGPGYANILNSAKLIPAVQDGKPIGFRVLSIQPGSLFSKLFQENDIVAEVNGVNMQDPSQGFKLYEALQEEREVTIGIIRDGQPMTKKVRVK